MKPLLLLVIACLFFPKNQGLAQAETGNNYRNFPIVFSLQFHSLAMPFKDLKSNFKNVGFGIGTEVSHNGLHNWVQQFDLIWIKNKGIGNGILLSTQTSYRPMMVGNIFAEVKAGVGYLKSFKPSQSYQQIDGKWNEAKKNGKGMLAFPIGLGLGQHNHSESSYISPFFGYQMILVTNYNQDIPIVPQTLFQIAGRIHPNYSNVIQD
ncbi:hypothetical protein A33Q_3968 [Indibacter alkaliphilus LW1]|uniref:Outer membrane protein beta-barrel domain-containing protein n=1 Tax=Indibacter alkaliphilus (strain CCUG 57479 / KCTC 22604 / LW1) TaxID=1189612 RepID=S2CZP1_INDAL|nr:hypothetical protein [Indibacter alkaliphilus]EOZ92587.1 hypothetical protein A33Q_3968 [Indibacter alkaliphilus LW1]